MAAHAIRRVVSYFAPPGRKTGPGFLNLHYWSIYFIKTKIYMHTKIWWSYVHIRYLVHVQKWTYLALGWPYGWALNFNNISQHIIIMYYVIRINGHYSSLLYCVSNFHFCFSVLAKMKYTKKIRSHFTQSVILLISTIYYIYRIRPN